MIDYACDRLSGTEVTLLDINEDHLNTVTRYASQLAEAVGVDMKFTGTTDRRQALEGADFIINTFRPGFHLQQDQDETVPPQVWAPGE